MTLACLVASFCFARFWKLKIGMKAILNRLLNITQKGWTALWNTIAVPDSHSDDDLSQLQDRVLQLIVASGLVLSLLTLLPALFFHIQTGFYTTALISILIYCAVASIVLLRTISYKTRAYVILLTLYCVGIWVVSTKGIISGGSFWLFTFAIIAGILLGMKAAGIAILINFVSLTTLGLLCQSELIAKNRLPFPSTERAIIAGLSFFFLNALAAFSIAELNQGLLKAIQRARQSKEALLHEIRMHKQTESFLTESEIKYRLLAENISDVLWALDMDLNITYANPAARRLLGWSLEELRQLRIEDLLTAVSLEKALKMLANNLTASESIQDDYLSGDVLELDMRTKDGNIIPTEVKASLIFSEKGNKPVGVMGIARDITGRIKTEQEKEVLQEKLAQSKKLEALGILAGGVANDLNNILSGIVSYPDLMLIDLPGDSPLRKPLETIKQTGHEASEIVQDLLALARRDAKTDNVICLNDVVNDCLASLEYDQLMQRHLNVTIKTLLDDDLLNIKGSPFHLEKVLLNLLINSVEAQPGGGVVAISTLNYHVDAASPGSANMEIGDYVRLRVSDQSHGLTQEDLKNIFEPFYTRNVLGRNGTGLGMAVVWGVVQDHAGLITVDSQEGVGTHFDIYFPITREPATPGHDELAVDSLLGSWQTILVVDDVPEQREIAVGILKRLRYYPLTAASGEAAVELLKKREGAPIDAVLLDMVMPPGMDGLDTYREILKLAPNIKALIASGFPETERVKKALELGVGAYIKKPYMILEIGLVLKKILTGAAFIKLSTGKNNPKSRAF